MRVPGVSECSIATSRESVSQLGLGDEDGNLPIELVLSLHIRDFGMHVVMTAMHYVGRHRHGDSRRVPFQAIFVVDCCCRSVFYGSELMRRSDSVL